VDPSVLLGPGPVPSATATTTHTAASAPAAPPLPPLVQPPPGSLTAQNAGVASGSSLAEALARSQQRASLEAQLALAVPGADGEPSLSSTPSAAALLPAAARLVSGTTPALPHLIEFPGPSGACCTPFYINCAGLIFDAADAGSLASLSDTGTPPSEQHQQQLYPNSITNKCVGRTNTPQPPGAPVSFVTVLLAGLVLAPSGASTSASSLPPAASARRRFAPCCLCSPPRYDYTSSCVLLRL
jgi:hypothetical protein